MMLYVPGNYITATTLSSVSSEDTPYYGKENMYDKNQGLPWGMTAKTNQYAVWDLGASRPTIICILNHNFTSAVTLTLKADNNPPNWGAPAWSQALTYHETNIYYVFSQNYRWWRLEISDGTNPVLPKVGEIVLYTYGSFAMNYKYPFIQRKTREVDENVSHYGKRWRRKRAVKMAYELDFDAVTDANLAGEVEDFFDAVDGENPVVFVPESTETICFYVDVLNELDAKRNFENLNAFSLSLEEQSRGIDLL